MKKMSMAATNSGHSHDWMALHPVENPPTDNRPQGVADRTSQEKQSHVAPAWNWSARPGQAGLAR